MPAQYDQPPYVGASSQEDINKYNQLSFYLAMMQVKYQEWYGVFNKLYGKINWQANMGPLMKAVQAVYSPVGRQKFYPNSIQTQAYKDVFGVLERTEQCNIKRHKFESQLFYFLPSWQNFRENQIDFNNENLNRNINISNDQFIQTVMLAKAPYLYVVGNTTAVENELVAVPSVAAGTDITSASDLKNAAFWITQCQKITSPGIRLSTVDRLVMSMRDDIGAPFFEGTVNTPKDDEQIKGKYVMLGSGELYDNFKWDPNIQDFRSNEWNIYKEGFSGTPFNHLTYKYQKYPFRIAADGTFPVPEIVDNNNDTVINPAYSSIASAPFEIAWILGADAYKTVKIGPPPKSFAGKSMSPEAFNGMNWNGEIQLTRNVPVVYTQPDGSTTYDTNKYGEFLQLISSLTMGCLATHARNAIPIIYQRTRPPTQGVIQG